MPLPGAGTGTKWRRKACATGSGWRKACGMNVTQQTVDLPQLRLRIFTPAANGERLWPGVLAYSDIFQHTGPHLRACTRLAAYGHVVIAPELYGRI